MQFRECWLSQGLNGMAMTSAFASSWGRELFCCFWGLNIIMYLPKQRMRHEDGDSVRKEIMTWRECKSLLQTKHDKNRALLSSFYWMRTCSNKSQPLLAPFFPQKRHVQIIVISKEMDPLARISITSEEAPRTGENERRIKVELVWGSSFN